MELLTLSLKSNNFPVILKFRAGDQKILNINEIIYYDNLIISYIAKLKKENFVYDEAEIHSKTEQITRKYSILYFEILKFDKRSKTYWIFIIQKLPRVAGNIISKFKGELFLIPPIVLDEREFRIQVLIKHEKMEEFKEFLEINNISYHWVNKKKFQMKESNIMNDALNFLKVLYEYGYFDDPKTSNSEKIAKILGISKSTVTRKFRKYERQLLDELIYSTH